MTNSLLRIYKRARRLIASPQCWSKGAVGRDAQGDHVENLSQAVSFCPIGALIMSYGEPNYSALPYPERDRLQQPLLRAIRAMDKSRPVHIPSWNDSPKRTHQEVLNAFDAAIRKMETKK